MPTVRHDDLTYCIESKLKGEIKRKKEHDWYSFKSGDKTVAFAKVSPPNKYRDFGDDILSKIAHQMQITLTLLKKSARCDVQATTDIIRRWNSLT